MDDRPALHWRVFLASPGDVAEERAFVHRLLESILPKDKSLAAQVRFTLVSWDDPDDGPPLPVGASPQEAITRFKGRPADCDLVLVLLYTRMGTHLDVAKFRKPDGRPYLSGTEWEFEDAFNAAPRPEIMLYRRTDVPAIPLNAPDRRERQAQFDLVEAFCARLRGPDGAWTSGINEYAGLDEFRDRLRSHMAHFIAEKLHAMSPPPGGPGTAQPDQSDVPPTTAGTAAPNDPGDAPLTTAPITPPARCLGRDDEAATLIAALSAPGQAALLVLGPAGIGKTTLTRRVATDQAVVARFGRHRYFVPLETATDADALRRAIIQAIGLNPAQTPFPTALAVLARQPALLVLDNLETPWEPSPSAAQDVLQALASTPNVSLLASLRGAAAPASPRWSSPPTRLGPLSDDDARALFIEFAPEAEADPTHLADFLTALGGVPLAVELVARRAAGDTSLVELWREWTRRGVALASDPDQEPGRLTSLGRSLDLSWGSRRLRAPGRKLFRLLGALPAGMADADRDALLGDTAFEAARELRAVGLAFAAVGRLDLLPPVREYAQRAHPPEGDEAALWLRHTLTLAREVGGRIFRAEGAAALARLAPEVANVEAALLAADAAGLRQAAVAALNGVYRLLSATGLGSLAPLASLAAACHAAADPRGEAACHFWRGVTAADRSDHAAARAAYEQALPLYRQVGDVQGEANCIASLGDIALRRSDHAAARAACEQALPLFRQVGDMQGEANCIQSLGDIALARSDHAAAYAAYEQALPLYRRVGDVQGEGNCQAMLGRVARDEGDRAAASRFGQAALALYQQVGARGNAALAHEDLARVTDGADRQAHLQAARALWTEIDLPDRVARLDRESG